MLLYICLWFNLNPKSNQLLGDYLMVKKLLPIFAIAFMLGACTEQSLDECLEGTHHSSFALLSCQAMTNADWQ